MRLDHCSESPSPLQQRCNQTIDDKRIAHSHARKQSMAKWLSRSKYTSTGLNRQTCNGSLRSQEADLSCSLLEPEHVCLRICQAGLQCIPLPRELPDRVLALQPLLVHGSIPFCQLCTNQGDLGLEPCCLSFVPGNLVPKPIGLLQAQQLFSLVN